jgi:hypothetical protein
MSYDWNYRLATSLADLTRGALKARGLPPPDLPDYKDFSARVNRNDGGQALRGFNYVSWLWDELTLAQAADLVRLAETALDAGTPLYLTIDLGWGGRYSRGRWVDVSGTPVVPQVTPVAKRGAWIAQNVELRVVDLTVENDPASGL